MTSYDAWKTTDRGDVDDRAAEDESEEAAAYAVELENERVMADDIARGDVWADGRDAFLVAEYEGRADAEAACPPYDGREMPRDLGFERAAMRL